MSLPPGPRMPRALQAVGWTQRPLPFLERCRRRYGDTFTLRILHWGDWVVLCDPDDVKKVFTAGDAVGVALANPLLGPVLGPRSVMLLEEPRHMTRRKLMLPAFHGKSIEGDAEMMAAVAREEVGRWPVGEPFELWPRMQGITQEVVMRAVFGSEEEEHASDACASCCGRLTAWMNDPRNLTQLATFGPRWVVRSRHFRRAMGPVEEAVMEEVRRRRAEGELREDVVSMLIAARYEDGSPLSERDLRDELLTLLTDGPTSSSLAWTFERLLRNPDKLARAQAEVREGGDGSLPRRGDQGDAAGAAAGAGGGAAAAGADAARRPRPAGGDGGRPLHPPDPPQRGDLPAGQELHPRALPRPPARDLHLDPLRRRHPPLPRRQLRRNGDEAGAAHGLLRGRAAAGREPLRADAQKRDLLQPRSQRAGDRRAVLTETDLLIVGAGAKAAGIATKVHVLNSLGLGPISLKIVEGTEPAASWLGRNGMTSGEEPLAVTPIKDIGFPYQSHYEFGEAGEAIDAGDDGLLLAAVHDRQAPLRALDRRRLALGPPPRLRRVPDLGARAGDRGGYARARPGHQGLAGARAERRWLVDGRGGRTGAPGTPAAPSSSPAPAPTAPSRTSPASPPASSTATASAASSPSCRRTASATSPSSAAGRARSAA